MWPDIVSWLDAGKCCGFSRGGCQAWFPSAFAMEFCLMALFFLNSRQAGNCVLGES